jgi:hypothetical protein
MRDDIRITRIESTEEIIDTRPITIEELKRFLSPVPQAPAIVDISTTEYQYETKVDMFNITVKKSLR